MIIDLSKPIPKSRFHLLASPDYMLRFFKKKAPSWGFGIMRDLTSLKVDVTRNFLNSFSNIAVSYTLSFGKKKILLRGRADNKHDFPRRSFQILKFLKKNKPSLAPSFFAYSANFNLLVYKNINGDALDQALRDRHTARDIISLTPKIARLLKQLHSFPVPQASVIPPKDERILTQENNHWLALVGKFYPEWMGEFKAKLSDCHNYFLKSSDVFLRFKPVIVHGDFHPGNILKQGVALSLLDFSDGHRGDPMEDVGRFLVQTQSMIYHYAPSEREKTDALSNLFIASYFSSLPSREERARILFWKTRTIFQIIAMMAFFPQRGKGANKINLKTYYLWQWLCKDLNELLH